jgi:hypothetical protein
VSVGAIPIAVPFQDRARNQSDQGAGEQVHEINNFGSRTQAHKMNRKKSMRLDAINREKQKRPEMLRIWPLG